MRYQLLWEYSEDTMRKITDWDSGGQTSVTLNTVSSVKLSATELSRQTSDSGLWTETTEEITLPALELGAC